MIPASAFHLSFFRLHNVPLGYSSRTFVYLRDAVNDNSGDSAIEETVSERGYSILPADSREKVLAIKLYRFGGKNVEEHMKSNPDLISRQEALRSLTPTFDDKGTQKIFYGDGAAGESVQFYAQADDLSSFSSTAAQGDENIRVSPEVLGSIEAVREYTGKGDDKKQVSIELKNLSVHKNFRRRGVGKALAEAVQEYARCQVSTLNQESQKYRGIVHLTVEFDNHGAMGLYKLAGFVLDNPKVKDGLCKLIWSTEGVHSV